MKIENVKQFMEIHNDDIDKIFLDVDGVIFHSCQAICDIMNKYYPLDKKVNGDEILSWNFKEAYPNLTDEEIEDLFSMDLFFDNVEFIDGVKDFISCHENDITIVTKATVENFTQKRKLFDKVGMKNIPIIPLPYYVSKGIINMENGLFIDDSTNNLKESNAKYKIQFREYDDNMNEQREWIKGWDGIYTYNWK